MLVDEYQRHIRYLRLSVTDRCNLRCRYCRVDHSFIPHETVLRYEEMERLITLAVGMGIQKIRLTGGEPFVRKGFLEFLLRLREHHPHIELRLTSNGVLLAPHAPLLSAVGARVNLSLDTFRPERFCAITGRDLLSRVQEAMEAMKNHGVPFKINAVAMKGWNDDELSTFLAIGQQWALDVRFIEFMPMGNDTLWNADQYWSAEDILAESQKLVTLEPVSSASGLDGPARMFTINGGPGRLGLITPLSNHFCGACNRLRLTSDGKLRTCLFHDKEYRLGGILRHPRLTDEHVAKVIHLATRQKPVGAAILDQRHKIAVANRSMTAIGG